MISVSTFSFFHLLQFIHFLSDFFFLFIMNSYVSINFIERIGCKIATLSASLPEKLHRNASSLQEVVTAPKHIFHGVAEERL